MSCYKDKKYIGVINQIKNFGKNGVYVFCFVFVFNISGKIFMQVSLLIGIKSYLLYQETKIKNFI